MSLIFGFVLGVIVASSFFLYRNSRMMPLSAEYDPERPYYVAVENKRVIGFKEFTSETELKKSRTIRDWQLSGYEIISCSKDELTDRMTDH